MDGLKVSEIIEIIFWCIFGVIDSEHFVKHLRKIWGNVVVIQELEQLPLKRIRE